MVDMLAYVEIIADVIKTLFHEWDNVENVATRFITFVENISLNILGRVK